MIDHVHELAVRTVDYNPNRPNVLATGGDDGFLRIWDTRQPKEALISVRHHKHWYSAAIEIAGLRSGSTQFDVVRFVVSSAYFQDLASGFQPLP